MRLLFAVVIACAAVWAGCSAQQRARDGHRPGRASRARPYMYSKAARVDHDFDYCWRFIAPGRGCRATDGWCRKKAREAHWQTASDRRERWLRAAGCPRLVLHPQEATCTTVFPRPPGAKPLKIPPKLFDETPAVPEIKPPRAATSAPTSR